MEDAIEELESWFLKHNAIIEPRINDMIISINGHSITFEGVKTLTVKTINK